MRRLLERWRALAPEDRNYEEMLRETNVLGAGRHLVRDAAARGELATLLSEVEASLDLAAAIGCIVDGRATSLEEMKVSCELEYWAFFAPARFERVLYIGCGAYPLIALYVLARQAQVVIDGVDVVPHATVLCRQVAGRLGLA